MRIFEDQRAWGKVAQSLLYHSYSVRFWPPISTVTLAPTRPCPESCLVVFSCSRTASAHIQYIFALNAFVFAYSLFCGTISRSRSGNVLLQTSDQHAQATQAPTKCTTAALSIKIPTLHTAMPISLFSIPIISATIPNSLFSSTFPIPGQIKTVAACRI